MSENPSKVLILASCIISISSVAMNSFAILKVINEDHTEPEFEEIRKTQMEKEINKNIIRIAIVGNSAYWIHQENIYKAAIDEEGFIDKDSAKIIDVFKLSEKEVNKLLSIMDVINS